MQDSEPILTFLRPYTPDLTSGIAHLNQTAGYYDANGHYVRVQPAGIGAFEPTSPLTAANSATVLNDYGPLGGPNYKLFKRCPGGSSAPLAGSNPFASPPFAGPPIGAPTGGATPPADCVTTDVVPGP
jgi:hypothetical protein